MENHLRTLGPGWNSPPTPHPPLPQGPELETHLEMEGLAGLVPAADKDLYGKLPLLSVPIVFPVQGPEQGLLLIHRWKEQINSSKLYRMGIL